MFEIIPFEPHHAARMIEQPLNSQLRNWISSGYAQELKANTEAFTGLVSGEVMVCGGIAKMWPGRGYLWSVLSENIRVHSISVYRGIRRWLNTRDYRRIEMDVPCHMEIAHRRAVWMGFEIEIQRARKYMPNGDDASIYVRIKE